MARGEGYAFINIGKFLERSVQSADILDVKFSDVDYDFAKTDTTYWKYLLLSISGYELYLKTYRSGFDAKNVVEQIVLNRGFSPISMNILSTSCIVIFNDSKATRIWRLITKLIL